ncbi:hypothetical protein K491DRAFT_697703 [Lophiostoma macrostomum CBS 122681]|uniref:Uncharacterized protein n=1 Tax=Lophiostoma macrostomum CBS 122681 TaxID=1314788 RepID=A0A6A6SU13_9PLEO|nr:hypothetical protein K491DRAFT_697703 [Lophiostoma macrostomum CBS 122681]
MASTQLAEPVVARSGSSIHSREEQEYLTPSEENPLEINRNTSTPATAKHTAEVNPIRSGTFDEPPPPYQELASETTDATQEATQDSTRPTPVEYSRENHPQMIQLPDSGADLPIPVESSAPHSNSMYSTLPELSPMQSPGSPALNSPALIPSPLHVRSSSTNKPTLRTSLVSTPSSIFSSAKAREAGYEIEPPIPVRSESMSSDPSINLLASTEPLKHTRVAGKLMAYLVPFPKPRLKGVRVENIPERFLVYTPPIPPLSKPVPGEKEGQWRKTKRNWQEDVRRATMTNASAASWKGMKAKSTLLIGRGVDRTRSSNVEFLDRASEGALSSTVEEIEEMDPAEDLEKDALKSGETSPTDTPEGTSRIPRTVTSVSSLIISGKEKDKEKEKITKPPTLDDLTLIYPPSLDLTPEKIRAEFMDTLMRTRTQSRKNALVASSLFPLAAGIDACLVVTFGGMMDIAGVWTYQSIKGASMSKKMSQGLALAEEQAAEKAKEAETPGCTCGHHENDFGFETNKPKEKGKKKKKDAINLSMQKNTHLEILSRYLALQCLKKDFNLFPHIEEAAGDVNEDAVLEAIGWQPTKRYGRDLEIEFKTKVETLTPEQDEGYQRKEAREDVRRIMKKGANEWTAWCKTFQKDYLKDPEAAVKK